MNAVVKFIRKYAMNHSLTFNAGHPVEGRSHDFNAKMGLAFGTRTRVSRVQMRFIDDVEMNRSERIGELGVYGVGDTHTRFREELLRLAR